MKRKSAVFGLHISILELGLFRRMGILSAISMVVPVAAVAAAGMAVLVSVNRPVLQESPTDSNAASKQTSVAPVQRDAALATAQQQANDLTALLTPPSPQAATGNGVPEFDIVHITPTGEAVVAGRAAPGST